MKTLFASIFLVLTLVACKPTEQAVLSSPSPPPPSPSASPDYVLVWADEFDQPDGSRPDPSRWNYSTGGYGWGNAELQSYTDRLDNAYIQDGMLVIKAQEEDGKYTSARLNTMVKGTWRYGRFEIRAKLPLTQGIWPAFWLLPSQAIYGNWPSGGEIDIMEFIGREPGRVYGTLHYGNPHTFVSGYYDLPSGQTFADNFHIFSLEWEPTEFRWYVDGHLYHRVSEWFTSAPHAAYPAPFDQKFYLIINVAVGGNWPGRPDETSVFPQYLYVDYARVYQRP